MFRIISLLGAGFITCIAMAGGAWAAKPPSGGGGIDTTPPGAIQSLTAVAATRAITLKFVAPGDDGMSGRAAGYDVYYSEGSSCGAASGTPPPGASWVLAPRSNQTTGELSGAVDFFNVHAGAPSDGDGLAAGMPYCVAIRARDEVPNRGLWSFIDATTLGTAGDWDLSPRLRLTGGTRAIAVNFDYPDPLGAPVLGWVVTDPSGPSDRTRMQFESSQWSLRYDVAAAPIFRIDNFRMVAIPGSSDRVGAVFGGRRDIAPYGNFHLFVEVGPTGPSTVETAVTGVEGPGGIAPPGSGITYVHRGTAWNPVIALERIVGKTVSKGQVTWTTQLAVRERVGGVWGSDQPTGISRTDASATWNFRDAQLFTKPDGTTLGLLVSHCDVLIYGERPANGGWTFWDAGPGPNYGAFVSIPDTANLAIGFNEVGAPIIARRTAYNGVLQITHPLTAPTPFVPPSACAGVPSQKPTAWESVAMAPDTDVPYIGVTAVAEVASSVYVAMNAYHGRGKTADQRVVYRCAAPPSNWQVASIDRTNGQSGTAAVGPVVVDGKLRRAYSWNWSNANNVNPLAPPDDFVVLASQLVTSLCP